MSQGSTVAQCAAGCSGVSLILLVAAFFAVTIMFYNKTFTSTVPITLEADSAGNQLAINSDVEVRGEIVGSVQSVNSSGERRRAPAGHGPGQDQHDPGERDRGAAAQDAVR